jgi:chromosome segregation ATPase
MASMKLPNPLHYPLAILIAAIGLVVGVRLLGVPWLVMLPIAVIIATAAAVLLQARDPETFGLDNPALAQELQRVKQQAMALANRASILRTEATQLLTRSDQLELLGTVQYACDRASELPGKIDHLIDRMHGSDSLLSVAEVQQQLTEVQTRLQHSSGIAHQQLQQLESSLQRNLQLVQQGQDARQAQAVSLSTVIQDSAGALQQLQNKLRSADLNDATTATEIRSLSNEFRSLQNNVELLVEIKN